MADKLLIRAYDVGVGDCLYVRIPGARRLDDGKLDDFHMLIDCGTRGRQEILKPVVRKIRDLLPDHSGDLKRLDLLVVTHEHEDHIKGFDPRDFRKIHIEAIWMSATMDPDHPQATETRNLHNNGQAALMGLMETGQALHPALADLLAINNPGAMEALRGKLGANKPAPTYVHAGQNSGTLGVALQGARIDILGPEQDIDGFYLGRQTRAALSSFTDGKPPAAAQPTAAAQTPDNISQADFRKLKSRMLSAGLAFAELDSRVKNNSCVVFLLTWQGKRLLFVGDCEWEHSFRDDKQNGGWNVIWHRRPDKLSDPIDFLKVGHHGSINSTPWDEGDPDHADGEPAAILNQILPVLRDGDPRTPVALVSTRRDKYDTIPDAQLLAELGRRVTNVVTYGDAFAASGTDTDTVLLFDEYEAEWFDRPQPARTDMAQILTEAEYVEVEIEGS